MIVDTIATLYATYPAAVLCLSGALALVIVVVLFAADAMGRYEP